MDKKKAAIGIALIALSMIPISKLLVSGLPPQLISTNSPACCGNRVGLDVSLSYFVYPFGFILLGVGSWFLISGAKELSLYSMKKET